MTHRRTPLAVVAASLAVVLLAGCAPEQPAAADTRIRIVTSTDVWGDVAQRVGGDEVAVTSLIADPSRDPHDFQASVRDQLAVDRADLLLENGGGYDDFLVQLAHAAHPRTVLDVAALSGRPQGADFNEHLWYDLPTVRRVAAALATALSRRAPDAAAGFSARLRAFDRQLDRLGEQEAAIRRVAAGRGVAITEPVPLYLTAACGLVDRTPPAFAAAIEGGSDPAPAVLQRQLDLLRARRVALLAENVQTDTPAGDLAVRTAHDAAVPVVAFRETLPPGTGYVRWIAQTLTDVRRAVER
ncbi:zinc ABC transporter substrate-binding protein [Amnibacterium sp. CER49]|uniref:metal ABC transporter solute-binding protein, Zn/Mn family n=1 Tax=Amnibacterium sp. CER49 TaxID=3039161 RepID=UPI00244B9342|nr:zinc ABC transporter substrate-binding protein [Amnibacterium sp. CER49]MDH2443655.1 zinc ABC transporter substrate-binding protein [Amnibacterium sp. CER49]